MLRIKIFRINKNTFITAGFYIALCILALFIRYRLFNAVNFDVSFFSDQYDFIKKNNGFFALKHNLELYPPFYYYFLTFVTYLPIQKFHAIKLIPATFDFILAFFCYKIVKRKYPHGFLPIIAFFAVLFSPTVYINSSFWGQFDVLHTTFLVASLFFLMKDKYFLAFFLYGLGISIKPQAFFFLPIFFILWTKNKFNFSYFLIIPATYILTLLPSVFAGRSFFTLLVLYFNSVEIFDILTLDAPNIYQFFPQYMDQRQLEMITSAGVVLTIAVSLLICYLVYNSRKKITDEILLGLTLLFMLIFPFLLPRMHERYFYPADIFSILFAFYKPQFFYVPFLVQFASFVSYLQFLFGYKPFGLAYFSVILLILIIIVGKQVLISVFTEN